MTKLLIQFSFSFFNDCRDGVNGLDKERPDAGEGDLLRSSEQIIRGSKRTLAACGRRGHGESVGWINKCRTRPGGGSRRGAGLLFAYHQETTRSEQGREVWKHIAEKGDREAPRTVWDSGVLSTRDDLLLRTDYSLTRDCLWARPAYFYPLYRKHVDETKRESERRCATCGTMETRRWHKAGVQYLFMQHFAGPGYRACKSSAMSADESAVDNG